MEEAELNLFRRARQLLRNKSVLEMNKQELSTVKAAQIPLGLLPEFNDLTTDQGLALLARILEGGKRGKTKKLKE